MLSPDFHLLQDNGFMAVSSEDKIEEFVTQFAKNSTLVHQGKQHLTNPVLLMTEIVIERQ